MTEGEQTTMGSGGPRRTSRRSAPPHPGSRLIRERITPPDAAQVSDDQGDDEQGGEDGKE